MRGILNTLIRVEQTASAGLKVGKVPRPLLAAACGCALGASVALMEFGNRRFQNFILLLMMARWSGQPCVKAAARHLEDNTQSFDAESISVFLDKCKNQ
ncbi:hypothetical protein MspRI1_22310 [Marinobacter sp. RI1]